MSEEREVVAKILRGDFQAFTLLVRRYEKLVFFVVNRLVPERADQEDICQEVFLKVHQNLPRFRFESKLSTWIARIAYLTGVDYVQKYRRKGESTHPEDLTDLHCTAGNPGQLLEEKDQAELLNRLIAELPEKYRVVLTLYHQQEFSCREIQQITGIAEGTVKSHLFRARQLLKDQLKIYLEENG